MTAGSMARETRNDTSATGDDLAGGAPVNPLQAAAMVGGLIAAGAGVYVGARVLARRNGARTGKPVSSVMANAITATDVKPH